MLTGLILFSAFLFAFSRMFWRNQIGGGMSPTCLYALVWGTTWFIFWSGFMLYSPLSNRASVYSAIPLLAIFLAECFALGTVGRVVRKEWVLRREALRRWTLTCGILTLFAGMVTFATSWMMFGNVLTHAQELKEMRVVLGPEMYSGSPLALLAKYSSLLLGASFPAIVLGALYMRLVDRRAWMGVALPLAGVILYDLGWGSRVSIFYALLLFITVNNLLPLPGSTRSKAPAPEAPGPRLRKRSILILAALVVGAIVTMNVIGVRTRDTATQFVGSRVLPLSLVQFIDYNMGTLVCFDYTLEDTQERTWGRMSFRGIEQWFRLFRVIPRSIPIPPQVYEWELRYIPFQANDPSGRSGNVFTWLRYLYSDFGVLGFVIIPWLVGWFGTRAVAAGLSKENGLSHITLAWIPYFAILTSGSVFPFRNDSFVFGVVLAYCAGRRVAGPSKALSRPSTCTEESVLLRLENRTSARETMAEQPSQGAS